MKDNSKPGFHPVAMFFWCALGGGPLVPVIFLPDMQQIGLIAIGVGAMVGGLWYFLRMNHRFVDDLVVNMVDVGEETGELEPQGVNVQALVSAQHRDRLSGVPYHKYVPARVEKVKS